MRIYRYRWRPESEVAIAKDQNSRRPHNQTNKSDRENRPLTGSFPHDIALFPSPQTDTYLAAHCGYRQTHQEVSEVFQFFRRIVLVIRS
jgi:hypothetical protein